MALLAITVLGHDRPGIIADVTAALAQRDANVEDSSMTLLRGHFAWTLIVGTEASVEQVASDLAFLSSDLQTHLGGGLYVVVAEVDFAEPMDTDVLAGRLRAVGQTVGVDVAVQAADQDVL